MSERLGRPRAGVLGPFGGSARSCWMSHPDASTAPCPHSQETCSPPLVMSTSHPSRMNSSTWSSSPRPTSGECAPGCPAFSGMAPPFSYSLSSVGPKRLGLDEGQLGEKAGCPNCVLLLVTLPWGGGGFLQVPAILPWSGPVSSPRCCGGRVFPAACGGEWGHPGHSLPQ